MKRIGYGKLGRVIELDPAKWGESGGDNEPSALLLTLATRHPDTTWVVVGKNSGWKPPLPNIENPWQEWNAATKVKAGTHVNDVIRMLDEVTMPTFGELDGVVVWLGQHGTSNSPIPKVDDATQVTSPQDSFVRYSSFLLRGINFWRRTDPLANEEVWLLPDVRNYLKARDLKWPRRHPILCQFDWSRTEWEERYGDPRVPWECGFSADVQVVNGKWKSIDQYVGSGLELVGIVDWGLNDSPGWEGRQSFGILINEARNYGMRPEMTRLDAMQRYVLPLDPAWVYGTWTAASLVKMGRDIKPMRYGNIYEQLGTVKSTFTTPSSGSEWATAKPWEAFAAGTICFFHPKYDTQGHIIPTLAAAHQRDDDTAQLARWLRVESPEQLAKRVKAINESKDTYEWLAGAQRRLLDYELKSQRCVTSIERRLGL